MNRRSLLVAVAVGAVAVAWSGTGVPQERAGGAKVVEGLWSGSWGGGERDGVVFQPVLAELVVEGDRVELNGFPGTGRLAGAVRLDPAARKLRITPARADDTRPAAKDVEYTYQVEGDRLTLTNHEKVAVTLSRVSAVGSPLANAQVEFVAAAEVNDAGDLLVTRFAALRAGGTKSTFFRPEPQRLSTKHATVLRVQDAGTEVVAVEAARRLVRDAQAVVVAYRADEGRPPAKSRGLWDDLGAPAPDGDAARRTFARLLRPGTLVFVLSARENVPQP